MAACLPICCRNNGSEGHRESFVKASSSRNRASLRRVRWKRETGCWDYGILRDACIGRKRKGRKEYCKRFLSGIEVTRVKKSNGKETMDYRGEGEIIVIRVLGIPRRDDLAAIFTVRENKGRCATA